MLRLCPGTQEKVILRIRRFSRYIKFMRNQWFGFRIMCHLCILCVMCRCFCKPQLHVNFVFSVSGLLRSETELTLSSSMSFLCTILVLPSMTAFQMTHNLRTQFLIILIFAFFFVVHSLYFHNYYFYVFIILLGYRFHFTFAVFQLIRTNCG